MGFFKWLLGWETVLCRQSPEPLTANELCALGRHNPLLVEGSFRGVVAARAYYVAIICANPDCPWFVCGMRIATKMEQAKSGNSTES